MTEQVRTIRLYGQLGAKFGRVHRLAVINTAEAVRALSVTVKGFEAYLMQARARGIEFACFIGKDNINEEGLTFPVGKSDIRIAPIIKGAKRGGLFQTIIGVAMIVVGNYAFGGLPWLINAGIAVTLGGVAQLLSPTQQGLSTKDGPENGASYNFNGPVNVTAQGNPVPLLYGEMMVGSATVSAGIFSEDQT